MMTVVGPSGLSHSHTYTHAHVRAHAHTQDPIAVFSVVISVLSPPEENKHCSKKITERDGPCVRAAI